MQPYTSNPEHYCAICSVYEVTVKPLSLIASTAPLNPYLKLGPKAKPETLNPFS